MAKIIGLPKLSPTMEQGVLASWAKREGDSVAVDDLLAEVETDKALMEFRSFDNGVLLKILAEEGSTLTPDTPVAIIGKVGEDIAELLASIAARTTVTSSSASEANSPTITEASASETSATVSMISAESEPREEGSRVLASPVVRKLARQRDIDLGRVQGSGPHGRIVKRDVELLQGGHALASAFATAADRQPPRVVPASAMRRTIARRLTEAKQTVPHFYLTVDCDVTELLAARAAMNAQLEREGEKVSLNDLMIKAVAVALRREPSVNASWIDNAIHYHQVVDISVAVAIDDGLTTPVVRSADRKGVLEIAREVRELAARAKTRRLKSEEISNGTFSISNLGMFGIEEFSAVINPPEGAILAVGAVREAPTVVDGAVAIRSRMKLTLSCDHRVVDGAVGAQFLRTLKQLVESPASMLL